MNGDVQIQADVLAELKWDARVDPAEVGVTVTDGIVTLAGTVGSYAERVAAQEASHRVPGVRDVANDLEVRLPDTLMRTDSEIARAVRWALEWDVMVPDQHIQSTVTQGWVMLDGTVQQWTQRDDAERAVRNLTGVHGVTNNVRVRSVAEGSSEQVRAEIEQALARWGFAGRIEVAVHDGTARVHGTVHSWVEKEAVFGLVRSTVGVHAVEDHVRVELAL
jgi:osmotically-inducible protein OsmY